MDSDFENNIRAAAIPYENDKAVKAYVITRRGQIPTSVSEVKTLDTPITELASNYTLWTSLWTPIEKMKKIFELVQSSSLDALADVECTLNSVGFDTIRYPELYQKIKNLDE